MIPYLFGLTIGELAAQFLLKSGIQNKIALVSGIFVYALVGYIYYLGLISNKFGALSISWHVMMAVITMIISVLVFKESYTKKEVFGLALGLISIVLLHHKGNH